MILAGLTTFVVFSLCVGSIFWEMTLLLGVVSGAALYLAGRGGHGGAGAIDALARRSRLSAWNPACKLLCTMALLALCLLSPSAVPPLVLSLALGGVVCLGGGLSARTYLRQLSLPGTFLLLSALALLWDYTATSAGILSLPVFGGYFVVTTQGQETTRLVLGRALGAVSCLFFLSLTTPMPEILATLRRLRVPTVVLDLAVLIYRYIFLLLDTYAEMKNAAASRLGYNGLRCSIRTTGMVYGHLLGRSFRRAGDCFDAMESRSYQGDIRFLERNCPANVPAVMALIGLVGGMTVLVVCAA